MIVSSLNVNGIRSATTKGLADWILKESPDVICFQELKALEDQVPEEIQSLNYYSYYHSAEKKGYSGVGILSKVEPKSVTIGCGIDWIDKEGRIIVAEFDSVVIVSVYAPSGTTGDERQLVKYQFLDAFLPYAESQRTKFNKEILFCGDFNIAHKEIDIHNPVSNKNSSGFLPEERDWFSGFLNSGYVDVFRSVNPSQKDVYSWWSFRAGARKNNKGWRIDYQLGTEKIAKTAKKAWIVNEPIFSDHAIVNIEYQL